MQLHVPAIQPDVLFTLAGLTITNTLVMSWLAIATLVGLALLSTRRMQLVPSGLQNLAEMVVEGLIGLAEQAGGAGARRFLPLVGTLFLYILIANWMGVLPGVGSLAITDPATHHSVILLRSANSDLSITAAMAVIVFLWVQFVGLQTSPRAYIMKFFWPPGLNILETIAEIARPLSLAMRLFGNVLAGFFLVEIFIQLAPPIVPALALGFELFVGLIQALIFAILTLAFLSLATAHGQTEDHQAPQEPPSAHWPARASQ